MTVLPVEPTEVARLIDEETFEWGFGCVPPIRWSRNRHIVGEAYRDRPGDWATLYPCNFCFADAAGRETYFQCLMTIAEYDAMDAIKFRRERIPACHPLHIHRGW